MAAVESNPGPAKLNPQACDGWIEKDTRRTRKLVIAKHIETGSIFMLGIRYLMHIYDDGLVLGTRLPGNFLKIVPFLSPPRQDLCFRNFTVAPFLGAKNHALMSVIWQETASEDSRPELYYYNVPCASSRDISLAESIASPDCATRSEDEAPVSGISGQVGDCFYSTTHGRHTSLKPSTRHFRYPNPTI